MPRCDQCGNDYDKSFTIAFGEQTGTFDSFECAIEMFAPGFAHCHCRVIGHGVEQADDIFCCFHCARHSGTHRSAGSCLDDRAIDDY